MPAKGGGYSELIVLLHNKQFEVVYYSNLYAFDPFINTLKNNFEMIVEVSEPYYNCLIYLNLQNKTGYNIFNHIITCFVYSKPKSPFILSSLSFGLSFNKL